MTISRTGPRFADRSTAGAALAERLAPMVGARTEDFAVAGITAGGVSVAAQVATRLGLPLDVVVVQRLFRPDRPWRTLGALAEQGALALAPGLPDPRLVGPNELESTVRTQRMHLRRRIRQIRGEHTALPCQGRTVLLVDDGLDDGTNARAACAALRARGAPRIVLAVPLATPAGSAAVTNAADRVVHLEIAEHPAAEYGRFPLIEDDEVRATLAGTAVEQAGRLLPSSRTQVQELRFSVTGGIVHGLLSRPEVSHGLVLVARLAAGQRHSSRSRTVAEAMNRAGLSALIIDLLTPEETRGPAPVRGCTDLARRLNQVARQMGTEFGWTARLGCDRGAAVVLEASAGDPGGDAQVCIDGDFTWLSAPGRVRGPVLLLARDDDAGAARATTLLSSLRCATRLETVPEPGATLARAATLAAGWLRRQAAPPVTVLTHVPSTRATAPLAQV